jgi:hypothetical protein
LVPQAVLMFTMDVDKMGFHQYSVRMFCILAFMLAICYFCFFMSKSEIIRSLQKIKIIPITGAVLYTILGSYVFVFLIQYKSVFLNMNLICEFSILWIIQLLCFIPYYLYKKSSLKNSDNHL